MSVTISVSLPDELFTNLEFSRPRNTKRSLYYQKLLKSGLKKELKNRWMYKMCRLLKITICKLFKHHE